MVRSVDDKLSRYVQGGQTYVDSVDNLITFWDRYDLPKSDDDILVEITPRYKVSPWLISSDYYRTPHYMWVVFQYNDLLGPDELEVGSFIKIPSPVRLKVGITIQPVGGKTE